MIPQDVVSRILDATSIEDVVGEFVTLKKSGSTLKALSPFSNERTPSFYVVPHKGIFKDFSSGKGGSAVTFLMEHEKMTYPEALRWLGRRYNIEVPDHQTPQQAEEAQKREAIMIALRYAAQYYRQRLLQSPQAMQYVAQRGITPEMCEAFGLGFAEQGYTKLYNHARQGGYTDDVLVAAGLVKRDDQGRMRDVFRDRIMFPIADAQGRTVGFTGRILSTETKAPKYLNTPETLVFHKGALLYGLDRARNAIRREDRALLVEGNTDVIAMHQAGIAHTVAASGTGFTTVQARLLRRFTRDITVVFDGDAAGSRAAMASIDVLLAEGLAVQVAAMPEGSDPDQYIQDHGAESMREMLEVRTQDFLRYKAGFLLSEADASPFQKAEAVRGLARSLSAIPDPIAQSYYVRECAAIMEVEERLLWVEMGARKGGARAVPAARQGRKPAAAAVSQDRKPGEMQEIRLAGLVVLYGGQPAGQNEGLTIAQAVLRTYGDMEFAHIGVQLLFREMGDALNQGREMPTLAHVLHHEHPEVAAIGRMFMDEGPKLYSPNHWVRTVGQAPAEPSDDPWAEVREVCRYLVLRDVQRKQNEAMAALRGEDDPEERAVWLQVVAHLNRQKSALSEGIVIYT